MDASPAWNRQPVLDLKLHLGRQNDFGTKSETSLERVQLLVGHDLCCDMAQRAQAPRLKVRPTIGTKGFPLGQAVRTQDQIHSRDFPL